MFLMLFMWCLLVTSAEDSAHSSTILPSLITTSTFYSILYFFYKQLIFHISYATTN